MNLISKKAYLIPLEDTDTVESLNLEDNRTIVVSVIKNDSYYSNSNPLADDINSLTIDF
jgi:hypothetical protein